MPNIRPSSDLRNNYNEISDYCHTNREPVFLTKNGHGDLVVLSIEDYEKISDRLELYRLLDQGIKDETDGKVRPLDDAISQLREEIKNKAV
ncbi:MAG: type II toxin-antitoxin system Phd/YefM family antitoxin [Oscillospiraceae bacterium]|nr:type II toxin-antitoxin system Phd/YefM family antitoxin [Candidatus Limimonas egerieequi]